MTDETEEAALVFRTTFRFTIDFRTWNRRPIARTVALGYAFKADHLLGYDGAFYWLKVTWRGYQQGTLFNPGV